MYFNTPKEPKDNEFKIYNDVYNIDEILKSKNPTYITLTSATKGYSNAASDAKNVIRVLLDSVVKNLKGYDRNKVQKAYQTIMNYYTAAINAVTIRDNNGTVGNSFSYYDAVNNKTVYSSDKSDMRSAWDHKDVDSAGEIKKKSNKGSTGIYIGRDKEKGGGLDNDKFYIYIDIQKVLKEFMALIK